VSWRKAEEPETYLGAAPIPQLIWIFDLLWIGWQERWSWGATLAPMRAGLPWRGGWQLRPKAASFLLELQRT
jgi:hypothetical protein